MNTFKARGYLRLGKGRAMIQNRQLSQFDTANPSLAGRYVHGPPRQGNPASGGLGIGGLAMDHHRDRKSTRLNSSHVKISYAVFCLKKKKQTRTLKQHHK